MEHWSETTLSLCVGLAVVNMSWIQEAQIEFEENQKDN